MYSSNVLMNELSCRKVSDFASAAADREPIAAPIAPSPASFRNPRRDLTSIPRTPCKPAPENSVGPTLLWSALCRGKPLSLGLEQSPVADDRQRRGAVGSAFARNFAAGRPAAAFEDAGEREVVGGFAEALAHPLSEAVEQRDGQCPPFDDGLAQRVEGAPQESGVTRLEDAAIDKKTAIAVFGKASKAVDLRDRQPRGLEQLDKRVGEPLAELVKRHEPLASYRWMAAAIAERNAAETDTPGQDRPEHRQQGQQDLG